ncbi:ATP-binding cassette domain-containing protein [Brevibacillus marinus]|uniref:ATP-binding cassette domain-containing protein n=1 Tax=Brevibacillus marinus TaxID=2496837 RepID=UPI000F84A52C|nr:ATP-binding cassette domain-containing protein [Brevibacillus marinus]
MSEGLPGKSVELKKLTKRFGEQTVLQEMDLYVKPGDFVAIVGKSGCGKSTLLRLLAGLEQPSSGEVCVDGQPLKGLNSEARIMFQDARLLPWKTVIDNVGIGLKGEWKTKAEKLLAQVGLADRANEWPAVLSGGQRQRVALARALVTEPHLLLLDEPLGALDALTRIEMQRLIEQIWSQQKFTALLVTHDVEEAVALADRVVLIEQGNIVLDIPIDLPRPRMRSSSKFASLVGKILARVLGEKERQEAFA